MGFNVTMRDTEDQFIRAIEAISKANGVAPNQVDREQLTMGYLTTMCDISPNQSLLQFPIVDTQNVAGAQNNLAIMRLLAMQDSFWVNSMSYYLLIYPFLNGNQNNPDFTGATVIGSNILTPITFPDPWHSYNSTSGYVLSAGMALMWNGYLSIEVDKKVIIPYWDCQRHLYIPQQQSTNISSPSASPYSFQQSQYDGSTDGYYPVSPSVVFGGGRQNIVKLNLPANVPASIAPFTLSGYGTNFVVKAVLCYRGILAQNSTSVR